MTNRQLAPLRSSWHVTFLAVAGLFFAAAEGFAAEVTANCLSTPQAGVDTSPAPSCGCVNGGGPVTVSGNWGSGSAAGFATVKALPGTVCHMNVGNVYRGPGHKIDTCDHLEGRAAEVANSDCDTISVIELLSDFQCAEQCIFDPDGEACRLCQGCGHEGAEDFVFDCERQAAVVCPPEQYEITCSQAPASSVGCDCLCRKKDVCAAQAPQCEEYRNIRYEGGWRDHSGETHPCDPGNYATCIKCTDPYGGPSTGSCAVHPSHCSNVLHPEDQAECLRVCSAGLMNLAAQKISDAAIRTMSGDFNCTPKGSPCLTYLYPPESPPVPITIIAECPWLDAGNSYQGMTVCRQTGASASVGLEGLGGGLPIVGALGGFSNCTLDFVLSTHCGCGETRVVTDGINYGDHRTIIFGQGVQPVLELLPGSSHRIVHGNSTVIGSDGKPLRRSYSSEETVGSLGYSCRASASCGSIAGVGTVTASQGVCESRHQARVRQATGCSLPGKALVCEQAGAWATGVGSGYGHAANTVDLAGANASASGNSWQARCDRQRRVVDLQPVSATQIVSGPLTFLSNADASCTAPPPSPGTPTSGGTLSGGN